MHGVALDLLILLAGVWLVAVTLRPLGLPTVMGELIVGVLVGPAVFGLIEPDDAIGLLAEIGIFVLVLAVGLVYVWSKGDLAWVKRVVTGPTGPEPGQV